jgi:hypothetical protein
MRRTGLSGDVGLMILWLFDSEDEDADGLSEKKGARKTKNACDLFLFQVSMHPSKYPNSGRTHPVPSRRYL